MKWNFLFFALALAFAAAGSVSWWQSHSANLNARAALAEMGLRQKSIDQDIQRLTTRLTDLDNQRTQQQTALDRQPDEAPPPAPVRAAVPPPAQKSDYNAARRTAEARVFNDPKAQASLLAATLAKAGISYAPFFKARNLTPAQIERFKDIMGRVAQIGIDLKGSELTLGTSAPQSVVQDYRSEMNGALTELLGAEGFDDYLQYSRTMAARDRAVSAIAGEMAAAAAPLSVAQATQLTQILADTRLPSTPGSAPSQDAYNWQRAVAQAYNVLTPEQRAVLQRTAEQRQTEIKIIAALIAWKP
ncbi:MAG: hypothetical protein HZA31_07765 [Opitutae bacterium]|nr:hypothetical protein [Opitutae bacterium]